MHKTQVKQKTGYRSDRYTKLINENIKVHYKRYLDDTIIKTGSNFGDIRFFYGSYMYLVSKFINSDKI